MLTLPPTPDEVGNAMAGRSSAIAVAGLLVTCTVLGLAGIDLILPAIPVLPDLLGGSIGEAQWVLAMFTAGTGVGLLLFGELGARWDVRTMLTLALAVYALTSLAAALVDSLPPLIALRFLQGVAASCAAVITPGIVRALFDEAGALRALGVLGSVESLAPAIAPIIGVWLLVQGGWSASFWVTACAAAALSGLVFCVRGRIPRIEGRRSGLGYVLLIRNTRFQRYALSQGLALASLLVFVFAMPTVFVVALGGEIRDFITMQVLGILSFIVAANSSSVLVRRVGAEATIFGGSLLALAGSTLMCLYGLSGGADARVIWALFIPVNMGFGFRGPPSFLLALQASEGDDARASALVVLYVMLATALGTTLLSPFVAIGLWPAAGASAVLGALSLVLLRVLPPLSTSESLSGLESTSRSKSTAER